MTATSWWEYVSDAMGDMSALEAGRKAGFDASAFTRWKKGASPDVSFVVKFARAFELNVLQALVAAEIITEEEAGTHEVRVGAGDALRAASAASLSEEVGRRLIALESEGRVVTGRFGELGVTKAVPKGVAAHVTKRSIFDEQEQRGE
jgi:hypothetical protein